MAHKIQETVHARLIGPQEQLRQTGETHGPFKLSDLSRLSGSSTDTSTVYRGTFPIDLVRGDLYILSSWDTNCYVRGVVYDEFVIEECYGPELDKETEYLLICPKY